MPPVKNRERTLIMVFIFDMGGVMVDNVDLLALISKEVGLSAAQLTGGLDSDTPYAVGLLAQLQSGSIKEKQYWHEIEVLYNKKIATDYWKELFFPKRISTMYNIVNELRKKHRVVCGTNTIPVHYEVHMKNGDYSCFDKVYASHLMDCIKPNSEFWLKILESENVSAKDCVFVDDNFYNVEAAKKLGLNSYLYTNANEISTILEKWL